MPAQRSRGHAAAGRHVIEERAHLGLVAAGVQVLGIGQEGRVGAVDGDPAHAGRGRHLHFAPRRQAEAAVEAEEQGLGQFAGEPPEAPRLGETGAHQRPGEPRQAGNTGRIARAYPRLQVDGRFTHGLPFPSRAP